MHDLARSRSSTPGEEAADVLVAGIQRGSVVCRSVDGRLRGPALGGGPTRRQPARPQGAEALALTGRRTMKASGTRPRLSKTFESAGPNCRRLFSPFGVQAGPSDHSAVCCGNRIFRGPATPLQIQTGVLQARKSLIILGLLAMKTGQSYTDHRDHQRAYPPCRNPRARRRQLSPPRG